MVRALRWPGIARARAATHWTRRRARLRPRQTHRRRLRGARSRRLRAPANLDHTLQGRTATRPAQASRWRAKCRAGHSDTSEGGHRLEAVLPQMDRLRELGVRWQRPVALRVRPQDAGQHGPAVARVSLRNEASLLMILQSARSSCFCHHRCRVPAQRRANRRRAHRPTHAGRRADRRLGAQATRRTKCEYPRSGRQGYWACFTTVQVLTSSG